MTVLRWIDREDPDYAGERELRFQVLREPLGMPRGSEKNTHEAACRHLVAVDEGVVIGCVIFRDDGDGSGQLMQMAVAPDVQGRGIGRLLVRELERAVAADGVREITMHARAIAQGFYERLGYHVHGEPFVEVGLPHLHMKRTLD